MQPYTEASNTLTVDIDISSPDEIVEKLKKCDQEMFQPSELNMSVKTLQSDEIITSICKVAKVTKDHLDDHSCKSMIIMSGCGTSGRIAFTMARTYNRIYSTKKFAYTIAGGDKALFTSQEAPEDDHKTGREDLIKEPPYAIPADAGTPVLEALRLKACEGKERVLYIGITCGLSAPYVAGQLDYCMDNPGVFTPVLLGFNPVSLARKVAISNWNKTFFDVAERMESLALQDKTFVINPVLMGEAIAGSSRMKGGTITKIILDLIFTTAASTLTSFEASLCKSMLTSYQNACHTFYKLYSSFLSKLLASAGASLKADDHLYYASSGETGALGIIDATECTPTYGSDLNDVRGFIKGGYSEYDNNEGDISKLGENYEISVSDFASLLSRGENLADRGKDTVIVTVTSPNDPVIKELDKSEALGSVLCKITERSNEKRIFVVCLLDNKMEQPALPSYLSDVTTLRINTNDIISDPISSLLTPSGRQRFQCSLLECWAKWMYNSVSTGAHVLKGKVMKNYMVDVKVSNQKLFHRSIGIVRRFCPNLSESEARKYLLCSIYELDDVDLTLLKSPVSSHILIATPKDKVVPTAIVMAHKKCRFEEARSLLRQYHVIREAIAKLTNQ